MTPANILVVDDEPDMLRYLQTLLESDSYRVETAETGLGALERVKREPAPDLVLLDLLMPDLDGLETLERLRKARPRLKVVMLTCVADPRKAVQAMRLGAEDYLTKPFLKSDLDAVLRNSVGSRPEAASDQEQTAEVEDLGDDLFFVSASPAMRKIRAQAAQVAGFDVPVLLLGESGTGKEVVARLIHKLSPRSSAPFLKVNCAALPSDLLESELFGYEQGAFTGATRSKPGKFELCQRGTILLDEIAEMSPLLQAKLLHVLQDRQFARLGSRTTVAVDVRILAATNIDIPRAIESGRLREDLYYRVNAFTIHLPPLRERREEIPFLLRHFLARFTAQYARVPLTISQALQDACLGYSWPGNLRELENFVKRCVIFGDEDLVLTELRLKTDVPAAEPPASPLTARAADLKSLVRGVKGEAEAQAILSALGEAGGVRKEAARLLNISYKALLYKMRQYGLD